MFLRNYFKIKALYTEMEVIYSLNGLSLIASKVKQVFLKHECSYF